MTIYLLDINLLLALMDPMHVHHEPSHQWFAENGQQAWATCPLTENGFIRIAGHPNYPNRPGDITAVFSIFRQLCEAAAHHFWPEDLSILDILTPDSIIPYRRHKISFIKSYMISVYYRNSETFSHPLELFFEAGQDRSLFVATALKFPDRLLRPWWGCG